VDAKCGFERRPFDDGAARQALGVAITYAASSCSDRAGPRGPGEATVTFERDGRVGGVVLAAPYAGTPAGACVARALGWASIRPFSQYAVAVRTRFVVSDEDGAAEDAANAPGLSGAPAASRSVAVEP
jgi:hypothetical protein